MTDLRDPARRVDPRARAMWTLECSVRAAALLIGVVAAAALAIEHPARWWGVAAVAAGAVVYVLGVPRWRYLVHRWEITDTAVYTQRGWWTRERRIAPMSRVQTVDYTQGLLARLFGLATLTVTTASAAGALRIDGLDRTQALALVDQLTLRAEEAGGDAT